MSGSNNTDMQDDIKLTEDEVNAEYLDWELAESHLRFFERLTFVLFLMGIMVMIGVNFFG